MHPDRVFVRKVEDLQRRVDPAGVSNSDDLEYEVLMASPLLREILMGSPQLIHLVNKERRLRIRFRVAVQPAYERAVLADKPIFYARMAAMDPDADIPGSQVEELNLAQFLRECVFFSNGQEVSVRDLIDYAANAAGGVHFGSKTKDKRAILAAVADRLTIEGVDSTLRFLSEIGRIVVTGITPLVDQVRDERDL